MVFRLNDRLYRSEIIPIRNKKDFLKRKTAHILSHIDLEALIWLSALIYLSIINPYEPKHINLCLFSLAGIENCPGCGLGRSIAMIFRGDLLGSFESHPLGIPALIFILKRVYQIIRNKTRKTTTNQMEALNG